MTHGKMHRGSWVVGHAGHGSKAWCLMGHVGHGSQKMNGLKYTDNMVRYRVGLVVWKNSIVSQGVNSCLCACQPQSRRPCPTIATRRFDTPSVSTSNTQLRESRGRQPESRRWHRLWRTRSLGTNATLRGYSEETSNKLFPGVILLAVSFSLLWCQLARCSCHSVADAVRWSKCLHPACNWVCLQLLVLIVLWWSRSGMFTAFLTFRFSHFWCNSIILIYLRFSIMSTCYSLLSLGWRISDIVTSS